MPHLERDIERRVCKDIERWARDNDVVLRAVKFSSPAMRGYPDRMVVWSGGGVLFIEFKRWGERPSALQSYTHDVLRSMGFEVQVHDNYNDAMEAIKTAVSATRKPAAGHGEDRQG